MQAKRKKLAKAISKTVLDMVDERNTFLGMGDVSVGVTRTLTVPSMDLEISIIIGSHSVPGKKQTGARKKKRTKRKS